MRSGSARVGESRQTVTFEPAPQRSISANIDFRKHIESANTSNSQTSRPSSQNASQDLSSGKKRLPRLIFPLPRASLVDLSGLVNLLGLSGASPSRTGAFHGGRHARHTRGVARVGITVQCRTGAESARPAEDVSRQSVRHAPGSSSFRVWRQAIRGRAGRHQRRMQLLDAAKSGMNAARMVTAPGPGRAPTSTLLTKLRRCCRRARARVWQVSAALPLRVAKRPEWPDGVIRYRP